jgi:hypothetical protein
VAVGGLPEKSSVSALGLNTVAAAPLLNLLLAPSLQQHQQHQRLHHCQW